jgi:hypothetical protein
MWRNLPAFPNFAGRDGLASDCQHSHLVTGISALRRDFVLSENSIRPGFASYGRTIASLRAMFAILQVLGVFVTDPFKLRSRLEAGNLLLRHQLSVGMRQATPRLRLRAADRALLIWMTRLWPSLLGVVQVVQPATVLRWHRAGSRAFCAGSHEIGQGGRGSIAALRAAPCAGVLDVGRPGTPER